MTLAFVVTWLSASLRLAGPVLLAALGETFAERSGILNVGIEGTMLLGALASYLVSYYIGMVWAGLLVAALVGIVAGVFLAWMYVTVRASQVVAGLVFNVLALGIASTVYRRMLGNSALPESIAMFRPLHIAHVSDLSLGGAYSFRPNHSFLFDAPVCLLRPFRFISNKFRSRFASVRRKSSCRGFRRNFRAAHALCGHANFERDCRNGRCLSGSSAGWSIS